MSNFSSVGYGAHFKPYVGKMGSDKVQKNLSLQNGRVRNISVFEGEIIRFYPYGYCPDQDPPYSYIYGLEPITLDEQESKKFALWYNKNNHSHEMFVISPVKNHEKFLCQMSKRDFYFGISLKIVIESSVFLHLNKEILYNWLRTFEVEEVVLTIESASRN